MEPIAFETKRGLVISAPAMIINDAHDVAWAEKYIKPNPALAWIVAKYVEADNPNQNNQFWSLSELRMARPSIDFAPMNLNHAPPSVGVWVANEMIYPTEGAETAAHSEPHPYIEVVGAYWKHQNPDRFEKVKAAYEAGMLYVSMECVSESLTCSGDLGCAETFAYAGPTSPTYCAHINEGKSVKQFNKPHFVGGALIVPPTRPGWNGADVKEISAMVRRYSEDAEALSVAQAVEDENEDENEVEDENEDEMDEMEDLIESIKGKLTVAEWEALMGMLMGHAQAGYKELKWGKPKPSRKMKAELDLLMDQAKTFTAEQRRQLAKRGAARPDGSFPTPTKQDWYNARQSIGRAKSSDRAAVIAYLKRRAKALGIPDEDIPEEWK